MRCDMQHLLDLEDHPFPGILLSFPAMVWMSLELQTVLILAFLLRVDYKAHKRKHYWPAMGKCKYLYSSNSEHYQNINTMEVEQFGVSYYGVSISVSVGSMQMVQQTIDSKSGEHGLGNADNNLSTHDKYFPLVVKKTALRDVQNENRIPKSVGNSPLSKDGGKTMNDIKVSGAKRPSSEDLMYRPVPCYESSASGAPNFRLVYARGKSEAEVGKLSHPEETAQPKRLQIESTVSTFPALVPLPVAPPIISSGKPSVPLPLGQSSTFSPAESSYIPVGSIVPSSNPKGEKNMHWEERYHQLQISLKKSDESDLDEYVQMLQSVSSVELSKHAIEVEKRSIQLSLEEAKEVQRVAILNFLGKSLKNFKAPSIHQSQSEK
uniref:Uncharacterized protein n=2 Tax=Populus alba TaxID=43335 RepID=A0A4U5NRR7_POPAL|nr:uncharacterized protein D5086_0000244430 [Populus alba]